MELDEVSLEQGRLRADMDTVRAYAVRNAGDWADLGWQNEPTVRISVRFVDHLDRHRAALAGLVEHPDRIEVGHARNTDARLTQVLGEIVSAGYRDRGLRGSGRRDNKVRLSFLASAAPAAEEVHRRYGDLVSLTVGVLPYPPAGRTIRPLADPPVTDGSLPVSLALVLNEPVLPAGDNGTGQLYVTNEGGTQLGIHTGIQLAWVYRPGAERPVSAYSGARAARGINISLAPGETSAGVGVLFDTASRDSAVGYHLPAGRYEVMAVFHYGTRNPDRSYGRLNIRAPRVPLTLV